jgi:hypothetical protein
MGKKAIIKNHKTQSTFIFRKIFYKRFCHDFLFSFLFSFLDFVLFLESVKTFLRKNFVEQQSIFSNEYINYAKIINDDLEEKNLEKFLTKNEL